jgi:hypothetical protein
MFGLYSYCRSYSLSTCCPTSVYRFPWWGFLIAKVEKVAKAMMPRSVAPLKVHMTAAVQVKMKLRIASLDI